MKRVTVSTYTATIYVGGDLQAAKALCRTYCDEVGMCVTVAPTSYVYTNGETDGVAVGFINYGRFPSDPDTIFAHAEALALRLIDGLDQESASIVATDRTVWMSKREYTPPTNNPPSTVGERHMTSSRYQPIDFLSSARTFPHPFTP